MGAVNLTNLGGRIDAIDSLVAVAGRDRTVASTTRGSENTAGASSFSNTAVERIAGLYVSNPGALLVASAGRGLTLAAGAASRSLRHSGQTTVKFCQVLKRKAPTRLLAGSC